MSDVTLSVVVPCYNYEAYVGEALDSIFSNSREADEIIVVDDGSTDDSRRVVEGRAGVRLIGKANGGMASALNAGIAASTGDVVVLLDADDTMEPERLAWIAAAFDDPAVAVAWHPLTMFDADGNTRGLCPHTPLPSGTAEDLGIERGLSSFALTSGLAVRRRVLSAVGVIPEEAFRTMAEGYLVRTAIFHGEVRATSRPLGRYRLHAQSMSKAIPEIGPAAIGALLDSRLSIADREHQLLVQSAQRAGHQVTVEQVRWHDGVYADMHLGRARLASPGRRAGRRAMGDLRAPATGTSFGRRVGRAASEAFYLLLPRRLVAWVFAVKLGHQKLPRWVRRLSRVYWAARAARQRIVARLRRPPRGR